MNTLLCVEYTVLRLVQKQNIHYNCLPTRINSYQNTICSLENIIERYVKAKTHSFMYDIKKPIVLITCLVCNVL